MSSLTNQLYRFGEFTLDADQRVLLRAGKPLALTPKVFDTLQILVESRGRIVEKDELMRRLWPDTFVEEANITYNIQQLRKSLNDDARNPRYIGTVARRGYRFIADIETVPCENGQAASQLAGNGFVNQLQNLPPETAAADEDTLPASLAAARASKRFIAVAIASVILLSGGVLLLWRFSARTNRSSAEVRGPEKASLKLERLTATGQSRMVAISPDGKYLAYSRGIERKSGLWLRQFATNTNVEIVPADALIFGLAFSNSGEYLYFVKGEPNATTLYRVSFFGGVPTKIFDHLEGNFSLSADDRQVALLRQTVSSNGEQQYSLITINADGSGERTLLVGTYPNSLEAPLWSPDGKSIICAYGSSEGGGQDVHLVEVRVADGAKKDLSPEKFFRIAKMAWLPGKNALVMSARKNLGDNNQLWRVSYPGMQISQISEELSPFLDLSIAANADRAVASQATRLSDIWVGPSREPQNLRKITQAIDNFCWTPDGRLVYASTTSGNRDLWIMNVDGSEQKQLTVDPAVDAAPAVTPDSRYIIFTSNRTGSFQVWRMNLDGSNQIQLTNGVSKDHPTISADGRWVYYNTTADWNLWQVSIDGGEPLQLTEYFAYWPAVSPDGKLIACSGRTGSKREILILPVAGGEPVKRLEFRGTGLSGARIKWTPDGKSVIYPTVLDGPTLILRQPLNGATTEEIVRFEHDELFDFGYSSNGQYLAATLGGWQHDVVLINDLNK
jgi:Tol biopolymer transport system component/DNA-binding winged helix-turn-helix (wHTH) protein